MLKKQQVRFITLHLQREMSVKFFGRISGDFLKKMQEVSITEVFAYIKQEKHPGHNNSYLKRLNYIVARNVNKAFV